MLMGVTFTNGIVLGFEWSMKHKLIQLHLTFISLVVIWGLDEDGEY